MELPATETYKIKVNDLVFTVQKTVSMVYTPTDPVDDYLKIGGADMCVEFKYNKRNPTIVELQWLHTAGRKCVEGDMLIQGENTLFLFYVSIQILKKYTPVTSIEFIDNSHFLCPLQDKSHVKIHLSHYYFLFHHGKTWYHDKLAAYPLNPDERNVYESFTQNFDDPATKPPTFDFKNEELNQLFMPIWRTTKKWKTFLNKIKDLPNICQKTYPWYYNAASLLMNRRSMPDTWCIDVEQLRFTPIPFTKMTGGRSKMKNYISDTSICVDYPIPSICRNLRFSRKPTVSPDAPSLNK